MIFAVGWFVATVVKRVLTGVLAAIGVDRLSERLGISRALGSQTLSGLLGTIVYLIILIPVLIAAVDALGIQAITQPATTMLNTILNALPNVFAAFIMLAIAFVVGKVIAELVTDLLTAMGFNMLMERMGFGRVPVPSTTTNTTTTMRGTAPTPPAMSQTTPARAVGTVVLVAIMLFTAVEAMRLLGFTAVAAMLAGVLTLAGQVVLGLIIFGVGLYLSNLAYNAIVANGSGQAEVLAIGARIAILVLAGSMALRQMGLANEIVDLAFGLMLGAVAVAVAIAFGLGGRDTAARLLERWRSSLEAGEVPGRAPAETPTRGNANPAYSPSTGDK